MADAVEKYLRDYAEPEAKAIDVARVEPHDAVLVVPAYAEPASFLSGYQAAVSRSHRVLVVVVVNAARGASSAALRSNQILSDELLGDVAQRRELVQAPPVHLVRGPQCSLIVIQRGTEPWLLPERQGVGLARKIGCDVALRLWHERRLSRPHLYCTDADAVLPTDYFSFTAKQSGSTILFPYQHRPAGDPDTDRATLLYELWFRSYVHGLHRAGSPYAWHALGSCLAVHAQSYAEVRGFPKREAGEDFYLLNKLTKVAAIERADARAVQLAARVSQRTPFGTGQAAQRIVAGASWRFYNPRSFEVLRVVLTALERFSAHPRWEDFRDGLAVLATRERNAVLQWFQELGAPEAWSRLAEQNPTPRLLRQLHGWFDGFRTLKMVHALRETAHEPVTWAEAARDLGLEVEEKPPQLPETDWLIRVCGQLAHREMLWGQLGTDAHG